MSNSYEEKRARRIERLQNAAQRAQKQSTAASQQATELAQILPFGQPILVGHHSETRHRAHVKRIGSAMDKSVAASKKADYYADRALAAENNTAISSDDPDAIEKLEAKLAAMERLQAVMREANKALRKGDDAPLLELGLSEAQIAQLKTPDYCGQTGFPTFQLSNNSANMKRVRERLEALKTRAGEQSREEPLAGGVTLVDNVEANRVQLLFPGKPDEAMRAALKSVGFRWAPSEGAWQMHRSAWALDKARALIMRVTGSPGEEANHA